MERITEKDLKNVVARLNEMTGFKNPGHSTIGAYRLNHAYGGVSLYQYVNKYGGIRDIFGCGHVPKRDLYNRLQAYIAGKSD